MLKEPLSDGMLTEVYELCILLGFEYEELPVIILASV